MKLLLPLVWGCTSAGWTYAADVGFEESAVVRRLQDGTMLVHLEFTNTAPASLLEPGTQHYGIFPSAVAEAMGRFSVDEFSLKMSQGLWDTKSWGYPMVAAPPGAELTGWVAGVDEDARSTRWAHFTNSASGLFCASLNQLDATKTVHPTVGFQRRGLVRNNRTSRLFYGAMAREYVCTENLTPWKKLLPCQTQAGIGQLLGDAKTLYGSHYHSLTTQARIICGGSSGKAPLGTGGECSVPLLQLVQSLTMVVAMPSPMPYTITLDSIMGSSITSQCALAKRSHVVVEVKSKEGRAGLSPTPSRFVAKELYCKDNVDADADTVPKTKAAVYDLKAMPQLALKPPSAASSNKFALNLTSVVKDAVGQGAASTAAFSVFNKGAARPPSPSARQESGRGQAPQTLTATRYATSNGRSWDSIVVEVRNSGKDSITVTIAQIVPSYLKVYISTLAVTTASLTNSSSGGGSGEIAAAVVLKSKFLPATSSGAPCFWELTAIVPAESETAVAVGFNRRFMGFMAYPPDPHKGFEVPSAIITATLPTPQSNSEGSGWTALILGTGEGGCRGVDDAVHEASGPANLRIYTEPLGVMMPSPDFSMPYNVISISSTIIAIAFASFLKLGTKLLIPDDADLQDEKAAVDAVPEPKLGGLQRFRAALFGGDKTGEYNDDGDGKPKAE